MTIELRLIRYAVALGEHGNYARAAEALKITQPSLSRSIASLEAELGVPLFDRGPKGAVPTAFGRVLIDCGDDVMQREAHLRREIALLAGLEQGSTGDRDRRSTNRRLREFFLRVVTLSQTWRGASSPPDLPERS